MHNKFSAKFLSVSKWFLYVLIFLLPVFFLPLSLDALEVNKQTLLILFSLLSLLAFTLHLFFAKHFSLRGGWLNVLPVLVLVASILSAIYSLSGYRSWIGSSLQEYASVLSTVGYVALFYLVANVLYTPQARIVVRKLLLLSSLLVGVIGLFSLFGFPLFPFNATNSVLFNTIGTINTFGLYLVVMSVFALGLFVSGACGRFEKIIGGLLLAATFVALCIIHFWVLWMVFGIGAFLILLCAFANTQTHVRLVSVIFTMAVAVLSVVFLVWSPAILSVSVPSEVIPSLSENLKIAQTSVGETSWLFGSGPGTYQFDFAKFHSISINDTGFWNTRFDRSGFFFLTAFVTTGIVGLLAWILFAGFFLGRGIERVARAKSQKAILPVALLAPFATLVFAFIFCEANLTLLFTLFLFAGLIVSKEEEPVESPTHIRHPKSLHGIMIGFVVLVSLILLSVLFGIFQRYAAEVAFARAVRLDRQNGSLEDMSRLLDRAASYNKYEDVYLRNLSQVMLLRVGQELDAVQTQGKGISEEQSKLLQALTGVAINSAVRATVLAPENVVNWAARGSVYREFIPLIKNAGAFALEAYERAIVLEPSNPDHFVQLARAYVTLADQASPLAASSDAAAAQKAKDDMAAYMTQALASLDRAVELKKDYAPAHYQLALMYERLDRLDDAVGKMESVVEYNAQDVGAKLQLALLYLKRDIAGDVARAQIALEQAVTLFPSFSNARWYLASVYEKQGNLDAAIEQVRKVAELNPDDPNVGSRLKQLEGKKTSSELPAPVSEPTQTP